MKRTVVYTRSLVVLAGLGVLSLQSASLLDNLKLGNNTKPRTTVNSEAWKSSRFDACEADAKKKVLEAKKDGKNAIIHRLEYASVLQAMGKFEESNQIFDEADQKLAENEKKAKVSVSEEFVNILTNPEQTPYRGYAYDGIMVNTYKTLNFLRLTNIDNARVELNAAGNRQKDAVELNKQRIAKAQEAIDQSKDKDKLGKTMEDQSFQDKLNSAYGFLDNLKSYGDYENPFTVYLEGLFYMANAVTPDESERSRKAFERASAFVPENPYLKQDLTAMKGFTEAKSIPPTTYVIFETGSAPSLAEIKFDVPTFSSGGSAPVAFPVPTLDNDYAPGLTVTVNGKAESTSLVASMDSVIGLEFKNAKPAMLRKTLLGAAGKGAMNFGASQGGAVPGLIARIVTQTVTRADCRSWHSLPKEIQVCRLPTPTDRKIELATNNNGGNKTVVNIGEGHFNIVHVRSISASGPLTISQIKLK